MSEIPSKFYETAKNVEMSPAEAVRCEMQEHVHKVAALWPETCRKTALAFAANALRLPYGRVKALYYGEARRIDAYEADQIRAYVQAASKLIEAQQHYNTLAREYLATAHPDLLRFAPRPLDGVEAETEVQVKR
jgi:hypothetical protein